MKPSEAEQVIETLTAAMKDDPSWSQIEPEPERRRKLLRLIIAESLKISKRLDGGIYVASHEGRVLGALITNPPGQAKISLSDYLNGIWMGLNLALQSPPTAVRTIKNLQTLQTLKPKETHNYFVFLGCIEQGRGIGSGLLRYAFAQNPEFPTYLETQNARNIPLYQRLGFELCNTVEHTYRGGPPSYGFFRPVEATNRASAPPNN